MTQLIRSTIFQLFLIASIAMTLSACGLGKPGGDSEPDNIERIKIFSKTSEYKIGDTDYLTAQVINLDGSQFNGNSSVSWVSSDKDKLTISSTGELVTYAAGEVTISAILNDHVGEKVVTVLANPEIQFIYPNIGTEEITQGQTLKVVAMAKMTTELHQVLDPEAELVWASSDENIATIDENGILTAVGYGEVTITVVFGEFSGEADLKIKPLLVEYEIPVTSVSVATGKRIKIASIGTFADETKAEVNKLLSWLSLDQEVVKVDDQGILTGLKPGPGTIRVNHKDTEYFIDVTVHSTVYAKTVVENSLTIAWSDMGASKYELYWSTQPGVTETGTPKETTDTEIVLNQFPSGDRLTKGINYYFRLKAIYGDSGVLGEEVQVYLPEGVRQSPIFTQNVRTHGTSTQVGNKIFFIGGIYSDITPHDTYVLNIGSSSRPIIDSVMSKDRYGHASCLDEPNNKIYVFGGISEDTNGIKTLESSIEVFDYVEEKWTVVQNNMQQARAFHSCVVGDGVFYLIGGEDIDGKPIDTIDTIEKFALPTGSAPQGTLSTFENTSFIPRSRSAATLVGAKLYVAGGSIDIDGTTTKSVQSFDLSQLTEPSPAWATTTELPLPGKNFQAYNINSQPVIVGGMVDTGVNQFVPATDILKLVGDSWESETTIPQGRDYATTTHYGDTVYYLGGEIDGSTIRDGLAYSVNEQMWYPRNISTQARIAHAHAKIGDEIFFFSGKSPKDEQYLLSNEKYNISTDTWTRIADSPIKRSDAAAVALNGKVYVMGGISENNQILSRVDIYDPTTDSWDQGVPLPTQRHGLSATVYKDKIYAVGGIDYQIENNEPQIPLDDDTTDIYTPVYVFDVAIKSWKLIEFEDSPFNAIYGRVEIVNDFLYYIGGQILVNDYSTYSYNQFVYRLDLLGNTWDGSYSSRGQLDRRSAGSTIRNETIYFVGGRTSSPSKQIVSINTSTNSVSSNSLSLSNVCSDPTVYNHEQHIYVIGCIDDNNNILTTEIFR